MDDEWYIRGATIKSSYTFQWYTPLGIGALIFIAIIEIAIIFGNVLVMLAVFYTAKLRTILNIYIINLAIADLLIGAFTVPISVYQLFKEVGNENLWLSIDIWTQTASIWSLVAISADRYVAVTRPIVYHRISTNRAIFFIICVWTLSFFVCLPTVLIWLDVLDELYGDNIYLLVYSVFGTFYLPFILMVFFYWRIYNIAVSTTNAINQGFLPTKISSNCDFRCEQMELRIHRGNSSNVDGNRGEHPPTHQFSAKKVTKARGTVAIILGVFTLTCSPMFIMFPLQHFFAASINGTVSLLIPWLTFCNSAMNPVVYALSNKDFRFGIKAILCKCCGKRKIESLQCSNKNQLSSSSV